MDVYGFNKSVTADLKTDAIRKKNGSGKLYGKEERMPLIPFIKPKEWTRVQWERGISL